MVVVNEIGTGSQVQARTEFTYDDANLTGNVTQLKSWDSTKGSYSSPLTTGNSISQTSQYETWASGATGKLVKTTEARGIQTRFTYGAVGTITDLYPTTIERALNTSIQCTESREYDFTTGLVTNITDVDNNLSTKTTYDAIGRPTLVQSAFTLTEETRTATQYFDTERRIVVPSDLDGIGDGKLVTIRHYDQLGRIRLTRQLEDSANESEAAETSGIKVQSRYMYTTGNSYVLTSNPYRAGTSQQAGSENSMGWTLTKE